MRATPVAHRVPVETVSRWFSFLDLDSLFRVTHVCARWRTIGFDQPNYWANIAIRDVNPGTLARSRHRITRGAERPMDHFEIDYTQKHDHDDPVLKSLIPLLRNAVPRARSLKVVIESMYRLHVEDALCLEASHLKVLLLYYAAGPHPEIHLRMPLGYQKKLFSNSPGKLRTVHLYNIILPSIVIAAFEKVDEVFFIHGYATRHEEFPSYLFDHFPHMTRLRLTGGECWFRNAPLPPRIHDRFARLAWVDLEFKPVSLPAFFDHLPMHDLSDLTIASPDDDGIYQTLEPLLSFFDLILTKTSPNEFLITVKSRQTTRVRRFAEPLRYYHAGGEYTNGLLVNDGFMEQLASFHIGISLWSRLKPWLASSMSMPKLILELDTDSPFVFTFPPEPLPCDNLVTLVIQAKYDFAHVAAEALVAFADRLTTQRIALELRRVGIDGPRDQLGARFTSIEYSLARYPTN